MKQKVHSVSYLAKAEFEFKNGVHDLVALPSGAEVVKVGLEVVGNTSTDEEIGIVSIGFKDESQRDYFLTSSVKDGMCTISIRDYTAVSNKVIVAEFNSQEQSAPREGGNEYVKGVLRVLYFLPSIIEVEY
ncbi:hypothetical protein HpHNI32_15750 [Helicobacter pylori]